MSPREGYPRIVAGSDMMELRLLPGVMDRGGLGYAPEADEEKDIELREGEPRIVDRFDTVDLALRVLLGVIDRGGLGYASEADEEKDIELSEGEPQIVDMVELALTLLEVMDPLLELIDPLLGVIDRAGLSLLGVLIRRRESEEAREAREPRLPS